MLHRLGKSPKNNTKTNLLLNSMEDEGVLFEVKEENYGCSDRRLRPSNKSKSSDFNELTPINRQEGSIKMEFEDDVGFSIVESSDLENQ